MRPVLIGTLEIQGLHFFTCPWSLTQELQARLHTRIVRKTSEPDAERLAVQWIVFLFFVHLFLSFIRIESRQFRMWRDFPFTYRMPMRQGKK
jgi:hypothetical protein